MERINREEGHLIMAAIRICAHREDAPPTVEQLADLLGMQSETVRLKVEALHEAGAVQVIDSAFERHFEVADHRVVDELKAEAEQTGMEEALAEFDQRKTEEQERLGQLFEDGEHERRRKERIKGMEDGLLSFDKKKPKNPFGDD